MPPRCPKGSRRSKKTGNCENTKKPKSPKIPKRPKSPKSPKRCKQDEILNPKTNRCVMRSGKIGREILGKKKKSSSPKKKKSSSPNTSKRYRLLLKDICTKHITFLENNNVIDGPTMAKFVKGKDRKSDLFKNVMESYKFVFQDNKCKDFMDGRRRI